MVFLVVGVGNKAVIVFECFLVILQLYFIIWVIISITFLMCLFNEKKFVGFLIDVHHKLFM